MYRWLYSRFGGRPWTHITRDWAAAHPTGLMLVALGCGLLLGRVLPDGTLWWMLPAVFVGFVLGHIFWGVPFVRRHG